MYELLYIYKIATIFQNIYAYINSENSFRYKNGILILSLDVLNKKAKYCFAFLRIYQIKILTLLLRNRMLRLR